MAIYSLSGRAGSGKDTAGRVIQELFIQNSSDLKCKYTDLKVLAPEGREYLSGWQIKKWAGPLRKVAAILLGMDEQFLYTDEFKQMTLPECWNSVNKCTADNSKVQFSDGSIEYWEKESEGHKYYKDVIIPMTGREFLQKLGTDAIRNGLHEQSWVNALMAEYIPEPCSYRKDRNGVRMGGEVWSHWIITDTRFPNELAAVKKAGGITIRINRETFVYPAANESRLEFQDLGKQLHPSETALDTAEFDHIIDNNGTIEQLAEKLNSIISNLNSHANNSTAWKGG